MSWPPRADEVFKCLWRIFKQCTECNYIPVGTPDSTPLPVNVDNCVKLDTRKEILQLWGESGVYVPAYGKIQSDSVELEDVSEITFTVQRFAGHCGLSVFANLQTSPNDINFDTCGYAGFTNLVFTNLAGITGQCTLPITIGPKYIRAEIENESLNDIIIRAWITLTKTC